MTPCSKDEKKKLIFELTKRTHDLLGIPAEKISVVLHDVISEDWGRAGYLSTHVDFEKVSRKLEMEKEE
ncbi:4-oxalocrotonate tautomerase family enzyme [Enterococcus quebecensis]|nr:4-oxalocrotonate tautomerase family enzyme [Enterococcus quebecensis]